ncbi:hypothetical protein INT44_008668 [Umbelopsis vinacea]|uniref:Integrase catalytic domain-containing protein n=1 Tax=Umbelopsis vinacea TaxID=44442 RepID=A0A8H7UHF5_9FUNG|nr:hypothetical protein INT44_008668 [Umbelopsis vinacea]
MAIFKDLFSHSSRGDEDMLPSLDCMDSSAIAYERDVHANNEVCRLSTSATSVQPAIGTFPLTFNNPSIVPSKASPRLMLTAILSATTVANCIARNSAKTRLPRLHRPRPKTHTAKSPKRTVASDITHGGARQSNTPSYSLPRPPRVPNASKLKATPPLVCCRKALQVSDRSNVSQWTCLALFNLPTTPTVRGDLLPWFSLPPLDGFIPRHDMPNEFLSDNPPPFDSYFVQSLVIRLGGFHIFSPAYHPQSNGLVERMMGTSRTTLTIFCTGANWDKHLHHLRWAYNSSFHPTVQDSPFFLCHAIDPLSSKEFIVWFSLFFITYLVPLSPNLSVSPTHFAVIVAGALDTFQRLGEHKISDQWMDNLRKWIGRSLLPQASEYSIFVDASDKGWGSVFRNQVVQGLWKAKERAQSINWRELMAIELALAFPDLRDTSSLLSLPLVAEAPPLSKGEAVWLHNDHKSHVDKDIPLKLLPRWVGPFRIMDVVSPLRYNIFNSTTTYQNVDISRLKRFHAHE